MNVNFNTGWTNLLSVFDPTGQIRVMLAIIGVAIAVFFLVKWMWEKRSGRGSGGFPIFPMILAAVLAAPAVLVPLILTIVGWLVGVVATILKGLTERGGA